MTWDEFWGDFDKAEYAAHIEHLSENELRKQHAIIQQKIISAGAAAALGVGAAFHTLGVSLLGTGTGARRLAYNNDKLEAIEARMNREGWPLSKLRKRDIAMGVGPSLAAAIIVPGAEHAASHFIGHAAGHGAAHYAGQHAGEVASHAVHHPVEFAQAVQHGVHDQVHAVGQAIAGKSVPLVPVDAIATNTTWFSGNMVGQAAASAAELKMVESTAEHAVKLGAKSVTAVASRHKSQPSPRPLRSKEALFPEEIRPLRSDTEKEVPRLKPQQKRPGEVAKRETQLAKPSLPKETSTLQNPKRGDPLAIPIIFVSYLLLPIIYSTAGLGGLCAATLVVNWRYLARGWPFTTPLIWVLLTGIAWVADYRALCLATCVIEMAITIAHCTKLTMYSLAIALCCILQSIYLSPLGGVNAKGFGCFIVIACLSYFGL